MLTFCNYLRGVELKKSDASLNEPLITKKLSNFPNFFKYFFRLVKILFPHIKCVASLLFLVLLVDVVALEYVVYQVGLLGGKYFKALSEKNLADFRDLAIFSIGIIIVNSVMKSLKDFVAKMLQIVWRKYLTLKLHELYFLNKNYYYLQIPQTANTRSSEIKEAHLNKVSPCTTVIILNDSSGSTNTLVKPVLVKNRRVNESALEMEHNATHISSLNSNENALISSANEQRANFGLDNPDQRITQDVNSLCESFSNIFPIILITPFVIGWYGYQVSEFWTIPGIKFTSTFFVPAIKNEILKKICMHLVRNRS